MTIWVGLIYLGLCVAVGMLANRRGRSGFGWFVIALIASPLLGFAFTLVLADKSKPLPSPQAQADNTPAAPVFSWPETGPFDTEVVGESHCQPALRHIVDQLGGHGDTTARLTATAVLVPYDNPQDPNAVRVEISGLPVGHLGRTDASAYRAVLKFKRSGVAPAACMARIVGGFVMEDGERAHYGVRLQLPYSQQ